MLHHKSKDTDNHYDNYNIYIDPCTGAHIISGTPLPEKVITSVPQTSNTRPIYNNYNYNIIDPNPESRLSDLVKSQKKDGS